MTSAARPQTRASQKPTESAKSLVPEKSDNIGAVLEENPMIMLEQRVEMLCARCDALARETRKLRDDNRKLRDNAGRAKQKIRDIIARIPESAMTNGGHPH